MFCFRNVYMWFLFLWVKHPLTHCSRSNPSIPTFQSLSQVSSFPALCLQALSAAAPSTPSSFWSCLSSTDSLIFSTLSWLPLRTWWELLSPQACSISSPRKNSMCSHSRNWTPISSTEFLMNVFLSSSKSPTSLLPPPPTIQKLSTRSTNRSKLQNEIWRFNEVCIIVAPLFKKY